LEALAAKNYNSWNEELNRIVVNSVNEKDKKGFLHRSVFTHL